MFRQSLLLCIILWATLRGCCLFATEPLDVEQELLGRALPAWNEQLAKLRDFDVRFRRWDYLLEATEKDDTKPRGSPSFYRLCWKESEGCFLRESANQADEDASGWVRDVVNPEYSFRVDRDQKRGAFELLNCSKRTDTRLITGVHEMGSIEGTRGLVVGTISIYSVTLPELLQSKSAFELIKAVRMASSQDPLRQVLHLEFKYLGQQTQTRRKNGVYWADIDPGRGYVVERAGIRTEGVSDQVIDLTYQHTPDFGLLPRTLRTVWTYYSNSPTREVMECEFDPPTRCDLPSSKFYLSGYGFPETILDAPKRSFWFRILSVVVAVMVLAGGFWLIFWADRRRKHKAS